MAERPQNPRPMVRCAAGLDPDHRRRKRLEEGHHLLAPQLLTQNYLLGGVHPMKLEQMFRRVQANSANLFHGRSPLFEICNDLILAQSMPSGAVHPNTLCGNSNWDTTKIAARLGISEPKLKRYMRRLKTARD